MVPAMGHTVTHCGAECLAIVSRLTQSRGFLGLSYVIVQITLLPVTAQVHRALTHPRQAHFPQLCIWLLS